MPRIKSKQVVVHPPVQQSPSKKALRRRRQREKKRMGTEELEAELRMGKAGTGELKATVASVIAAIMDPEDFDAVRFGEQLNALKTGVAKTKIESDLQVNAAPQTGFLMDDNIAFAIQKYSYANQAIVYTPNPSQQLMQYDLYANPDFLNGEEVTAPYNAPAMSFMVDGNESNRRNMKFSYGLVSGTSEYAPHGPILCMGQSSPDDNRSWIWMDPSATLTFSSVTSGWGLTVWGLKWVNGTISNMDSETINAGAPTFAVTESAYYSIDFTTSGADGPMNLQVELNSSGPCFGHLPCQEFLTDAPRFSKGRVTAASTRLSNGVNMLNRQGYAAKQLVPGGTNWTSYIGMGFKDFSQQINARNIGFTKGCFSFLKPATIDDFNYRKEHDQVNGILMQTRFPLNDPAPMLATMIKVDSPDGIDGMWFFAAHIEVQSKNAWFELRVASVSFDAWKAAFQTLKNVDEIYPNETHLDKIKGFLKGAVPWIVKNVPNIIEKIGPYAMDLAALL